ncbi:SDR family NAD(P)-dependent oxidoreductase [candidate division WWE3 bacterium]|nr:SDR family NAD(P)-dependent oxidoreductase [candidate division WWE3 bacterium]
MNLKNKNCLITGSAKGIGKAFAHTFAEKGTNLLLLDINKTKLEKLKEQLLQKHPKLIIETIKIDLTNAQKIKDLAEAFNKENLPIHVLINNAGIGIYKDLEEQDLASWEKAWQLNVTAPFLLTKYLLPNLGAAGKSEKNERPYVLNTGSGCGLKGKAGRASYCTTKFALRGLSLTLAKELEKKAQVVHLALGSVLTEFGPLEVTDKKDLCQKGKCYLSPREVAEKVVELIEKDYARPEFEMYPKGYWESFD